MLNLNDGFIVSDEVKDGMDTARAHGIWYLFQKRGSTNAIRSTVLFVKPDGNCVRHPLASMAPANNPKNFTRDQLICLTAGLFAKNHFSYCRAIFWAHFRRFFFCQNIERDWPGSTKYPWPHKMKNGDKADNGKWRMFDFCDPLLPHHIGHLIRCAKLYSLFWFLPFSNIFLWLSCVFNDSDRLNNEQNQLQCMVKVAGPYWVWLYKKYNPSWRIQTLYYWSDQRNTPYISDMIIRDFSRDL